MKCAHCGTDNTYQERQPSGTCKSCRKRFVFEPKIGDRVTDVLFHAAIEAVSSGGRVRWGVEHLYYDVCRRMRSRLSRWPVLVFPVLLFGLGAYLVTRGGAKSSDANNLGWFWIVIAALVLAFSLHRWSRRPLARSVLEWSAFEGLFQRWCSVNGMPKSLIVRQPQLLAPTITERDIGHYSFDRAVICDRARTADLLLANNFHFENNCAVLAIGGYPKGPFALVKKMLMNNPRLQVFAVHDATPEGCAMAHTLAYAQDWFGGHIKVVDLGLRPRHAAPFRGLYVSPKGDGARELRGVEAGEVRWMAKHWLELAAARPEQILKRLHRGLQAHANDDFATGGTTTCSVFDAGPSSDSPESDGADGDSFG